MTDLKTLTNITTHKVIVADSSKLNMLADKSVNLVVTSPPYPMIEMWDELFSEQDPMVINELRDGRGMQAFQRMHNILKKTWDECDRVLKDNGFICVNVGDATRTIDGNFQLYPNHAKVIEHFSDMGYSVLPDIHWRKQSNSPNKFMGSGMYPAGAYVTYEHEYILIFRKGGKRIFKGQEKTLRQKSAFFWEERNVWFSDLWEIQGTSQTITGAKARRERNASFPLEIPYRLINMYSSEGDLVLDPFAGLGTTGIACMLSNRNSICVEIDSDIADLAVSLMNIPVSVANKHIEDRIQRHINFINNLPEEKQKKCYQNRLHGFYVKTKQETAIEIDQLKHIDRKDNTYICTYMLYNKKTSNTQMELSLT